MGDSLPRMPMNRRAKFDTASFVLGGEICNRTNTKLQTNKKYTIYPHYAYRHVWIRSTLVSLTVASNCNKSICCCVIWRRTWVWLIGWLLTLSVLPWQRRLSVVSPDDVFPTLRQCVRINILSPASIAAMFARLAGWLRLSGCW